MDRALVRGVVVFRWVALAWMAFIVGLNRDDVVRWWLCILLVGLAFTVTAYSTWAAAKSPGTVLQWPFVLTESAVIAALAIGGGWVFDTGEVSNTTALASQWALAGVLNAGFAFGLWVGVGAGLALSVERVIGGMINDGGSLSSGEWLSALSSAVTFVLAGALAGGLVTLLRKAERQVAVAEAREEVARTLHDGVLQTLAVIERRADDPTLAQMAREQELELREFLFGTGTTSERGGARDVGPSLRAHAKKYEARFGGRVDVILAPDLPHLEEDVADAITGAVGEALNNAGKHGHASRVTIYVEPADSHGVNVSVRDDGEGFDVDAVTEGIGLSRSIRGRMSERRGIVEIESAPGRGTEVRLWVP